MHPLALTLVLTLRVFQPLHPIVVEPHKGTSSTANAFAQLGQTFLNSQKSMPARKYCEAALQIEPLNDDALHCLDQVISLEQQQSAKATEDRVEAQISEANAFNELHQYEKEIDLLSKTLVLAREGNLPKKATEIETLLKAAQPPFRYQVTKKVTSGWILDVLILMFAALLSYGILVIFRSLYRRIRAAKFNVLGLSVIRKWALLPVDDDQKLGATELLFEAMERLPKELTSEVEIPTILPLRPVIGKPYEPEVWKDFQVQPPSKVRELERNVEIELKLHDFALADAARDMQFKFGGFESGSVSRLSQGIWRWFNRGVPTITGSAKLTPGTDRQEVTVRLTRTEGKNFVSVGASTTHRNSSDAAKLATERAAYKLLYLFADPTCNSAKIDALAARRQGIKLLNGHVSSGHASSDRDPALEQALENFAFARGGMETHPETCEIHLFEGIATALLGRTDEALLHFGEVQDLGSPRSVRELLLSTQSTYNCAVVYQRKSKLEDASNELENLSTAIQLYDRVLKVAIDPESLKQLSTQQDDNQALDENMKKGLKALQFLARFGRILATSQYLERDTNKRAQRDIADSWIDAAEAFLKDLKKPYVGGPTAVPTPFSEDRISEFIALEAHRAFVSLISCCMQRWFYPKNLHTLDARWTAILTSAAESLEFLVVHAVPDAAVYRSVVLINLGLSRLRQADDAACKALRMGADDEILYYAAAVAAKNDRPVDAYKLCKDFKGSRTIPEFDALCNGLSA
jgi:hypothetical protein